MDRISFWGAPGNSQTYLNIFYLLISYSLGIFYFIFLIVGLALGFGLFITWFGIPILVGVMFCWLGFAYFERGLSRTLLRMEVPYVSELAPKKSGIWITLKDRFADSYTWKSFGYLVLKFPLGVLAFSILVIFIAVTVSFIATPFLFGLSESGAISVPVCSGSDWCWVASWSVAILVGLIGILMIFVSMAIFNGLARTYGYLARVMLSNRSSVKKPRKKVVVKAVKKKVPYKRKKVFGKKTSVKRKKK